MHFVQIQLRGTRSTALVHARLWKAKVSLAVGAECNETSTILYGLGASVTIHPPRLGRFGVIRLQ